MIGKMIHRISIKSISKTSDNRGGFTATVNQVKDIFANVEILNGKRKIEYGLPMQRVGYKITARWDSVSSYNLNVNKLVFNGVDLIIHEIINKDNRGRYAEIIAESKV